MIIATVLQKKNLCFCSPLFLLGASQLEDEVLDTSLTPAQIKQLEEKRASEARSRAIQLEAHEEAARQEQYAVELRQVKI